MTIFGRRIAALALGSASLAAMVATPAMAQAQVRSFDIPAQPLSTAILEFSRQADVLVVLPPELAAGKRSVALRGNFPVETAIAQLLERSGLRAIRNPAGGYRVGPLDAASAGEGEGDADGTEAKQEIVVTGTNIRGSTPASPVKVVTRKDIDRGGFNQAGEILASLPQNFTGGSNPGVFGVQGINGGTSTSSAQTANLRGLGENTTLTLINGRRFAYNSTSNAVDISVIPVSVIERVEVETDGASALYGSDAVGGVVNFILKKRYSGAELSATISDPVGSGGFGQKYSGLAGTAWATGSVLGSFEYSHDKDLLASDRKFSAGADDPNTLYPRLRRKSAYASLTQELAPGIEAEIQGLYTNRDNRFYQSVGPYGSQSTFNTEQYGGTAGLTATIGASWHVALSGTYAHTRSTGTTRTFMIANNASLGSNSTREETSLADVNLLASGTLASLPSGDLKVAVGASYRRETLYAGLGYTPVDEARTIKAVFGEAVLPLVQPDSTRTLLNSLQLSAAVRYENYSTFGNTTNPKFGIVYAPAPGLRLKATWGRSFRAPTLNQQSGLSQPILYPAASFGVTAPATATVMLGSGANILKRLRPERAKSMTLTAEFEPKAVPGLQLATTYFHIDYRDKLARAFTTLTNTLTDPIYAGFVIRMPSAAFQQSVIDGSSSPLVDITGGGYNPANVIAFVDGYVNNLATQTVRGFDLSARYGFDTEVGQFDLNGAASFMTFDQVLLAGTASRRVSGTIFNPPEGRFRLGLSWSKAIVNASIFINHIRGVTDDLTLPAQRVNGFTTVDVQLGITTPGGRGLLDGLRIALNAQNLLNQDPPFVRAASTLVRGMGYDSANASAFGRVLRLSVTKAW